jgi:hypothetical protein
MQRVQEREKERWTWRQAQVATITVHRQEPPRPEIGEGWFDEESQTLYVWDGSEWVCVAAD